MKSCVFFFIRIYHSVAYLFPTHCCKYSPTCSEYAREAFKQYPFIKAFFLMVKRILRCHPFAKGGFNPLPL